MKGIVLAGGSGTRLYSITTIFNKNFNAGIVKAFEHYLGKYGVV